MTKLMKGHTWAKGKHKLTYPASAEVKVDEIRLDLRREPLGVIFRSYADKPLHNLDPFQELFGRYMRAFEVERLDMGVIVNRSFADTYRYVRSSKGVPAELANAKVEFILFDMPDLIDMPYIDRIQQRRRHSNIMGDYGLPVFVPQRKVVYDEAEVMAMYSTVRDDGGEGLMVKDHQGRYEADKRTYGWLKVKPEEDADGLVTGVLEALGSTPENKGQPLGRVGSLQVTLEDGSTASVAGIPHEIGRAWLADPTLIVGQWIEFNYMERDRQDGYRHPRFNRIREAKA